MRNLSLAAVALVLTSGAELTTDYAQSRALRIESESTFFMETTDMEILRDGEPIEGNFGGAGSSTETTHKIVQIVEFKEHADGMPTTVRHTFEEVGGNSVMERAEDSREREIESPFDEAVIELTLGEDGVEAEVVEGDVPEDSLDQLGLTLALDSILPDGEVDVDDEWELDGEAILRGLGLDMRRTLFPPPEREEAPEGGGRRGGRRGGFGMRSAGSGLMMQADWEGKATLVSLNVDHEGLTCAEVALELECTYDIPDPEPREGGGRRGDRMAGPSGATTIVEGQFSVEIEGRLLVSLEENRPVLLELEGDASSERHIERSRGESTMTISTSQEGTFSLLVTVGIQENE